ncbi:RNA polymerase sigma-70 factor [Dysgonomonas sp. 511]|uniref:RNA polymerase sigma-70 factor n=1 Tax=Dysgonomonas sp. 511 TaxID=2302930 RepID=UPI0013D5779F|nr:RNA polymerase sigma-70 factor [Dysgonomonas sp. 511]NDV79307.1 RNA polymerase sigma-70 factor [Dysgonomonas sp. 511]
MKFIDNNPVLREDFAKFFIETYPKVKAFARQILMSEEDAEDVSQDIYLKLIDMPEIWNNLEKRNNYLFKMVKNHIFNFIKHKNIERKYQQGQVDKNPIIEEFGIDDKLHAKEIELILTYAIEQMPERRKEIFKMSRFEGKSNASIAQLLDMSVRTVERHLYLALADLKKKLLFYIPH